MKINPSIIFLTIGGLFSIIGVFLSFIESSTRDKAMLKIATENAQTSKQNLELISGGNTFAYLSNYYWCDDGIGGDTIKLVINIDGMHPIYDLRISLYEIDFDFEKTEQDLEKERNDPNREIRRSNQRLLLDKSIGTLGKGITREEYCQVTLNQNKYKNYFLVKFRARNGESTQHIMFRRREDKRWDYATKVIQYIYDKENVFTVKTIFEKNDKNFPKEEIKWFL